MPLLTLPGGMFSCTVSEAYSRRVIGCTLGPVHTSLCDGIEKHTRHCLLRVDAAAGIMPLQDSACEPCA